MTSQKSKVKWAGLFSLLLAIAALFVCSKLVLASSSETHKPIEMKMAHYQPEQRVLMVGAKWWAEQVKERTNGRILIKHYFGGTLARAKEILPLVSRGGIEVGTPALAYHVSEFPLMNLVADYPWSSIDELFWMLPRLVDEVPALAAECSPWPE